jgi:hypothetical protein
LLKGLIFFTNPRVDEREINNEFGAVHDVFVQRRELTGALTFANRVILPPKGGIDQSQDPDARGVVRLFANNLFLRDSGAIERRFRACLLSEGARYKSFDESRRRSKIKNQLTGCDGTDRPLRGSAIPVA